MKVSREEIKISINRFDSMIREKEVKSPSKKEDIQVRKNPIIRYKAAKKEKKVIRKLMCDICSEEFEEYKMVRLFTCHHLFC